jgi:hypothetical protein
MTQDRWTPEAVSRILINPRYVLTNPQVVTDEQWIQANAKLMRDMGPETYLATLLSILRADDFGNS